MEYTKTVTVKRTYNVEFFPYALDCTVGDFIQQRERLGIPTQGFKNLFHLWPAFGHEQNTDCDQRIRKRKPVRV